MSRKKKAKSKLRARRFGIEVELLEDLHSGSGLGSAVFDRTLARDHLGRPMVPRSHVEGVWREGARRLERLEIIQTGTAIRLFGREHGQRGCLVGPDLIAEAPRLLAWEATAREAGSRVPDDHSLRRSEYLGAGTVLGGTIFLETEDPSLVEALKAIIRFCDRLGAERSRGSGQIRISALEPIKFIQPAKGLHPVKYHGGVLRLLLRAEVPVCIPTTGFPGNIIESEGHIPGRTLLGALAGWAVARGRLPSSLLERRVQIGPAYPLPQGHQEPTLDELKELELVPVPLSLYTEKPGTGDSREPGAPARWPHWANKAPPPAYKDMLWQGSGGEDGIPETHFKRPKDDGLLLRSKPGRWTRYQPGLLLRMRNQRGDSFEQVPEDKKSLFTSEHIPADTLFIADLSAADSKDMAALVKDLDGFLPATKQGVNGLEYLRVGRGGSPVSLVRWSTLTAQKPTSTATATRITLTTDLIVRDPFTLGFHPELSARALCDAFGVEAPNKEPRGYSDSRDMIGFNASTGLPQPPRRSIRRGSTLVLNGDLAAVVVDARLANGDAIGDRTWEGHGRYRIDLDPLADGIDLWKAPASPLSHYDGTDIAARESVLAAVETFLSLFGSVGLPISRTQLGNLRNTLSGLSADAVWSKIEKKLTEFHERTAKRRDAGRWHQVLEGEAGLIAHMKTPLRESPEPLLGALLFLRALEPTSREESSDDG